MDPLTAAIVWSVVWAIITLVSFWAGLIILIHGSIIGGAALGRSAVAVTVPVGLVLLAFSLFSIIRTVIQIVDAFQVGG